MNRSITTFCAPKLPVRTTVSGFLAIAASVLIAVLCGADTVHAQNYVYFPSYGYGNQYPGTVSYQGGMVAGEQFKAINTFTFNSLGFIDVNNTNALGGGSSDGLIGSYEVGIWLVSSQQLLASTLVTPDSKLINGFRYSPIPATTIPAGASFMLGVVLPENLQDSYLINVVNYLSPSFSGAGFGRSAIGATSLTYPTGTTNMGTMAVAIVNASDAIVPPVVPTPSVIRNVTGVGTNLVFTVTNGLPGRGWTLLTTTNLTPPVIWSTNLTGTFDGQGTVTLTNGTMSTESSRYFIIRTP